MTLKTKGNAYASRSKVEKGFRQIFEDSERAFELLNQIKEREFKADLGYRLGRELFHKKFKKGFFVDKNGMPLFYDQFLSKIPLNEFLEASDSGVLDEILESESFDMPPQLASYSSEEFLDYVVEKTMNHDHHENESKGHKYRVGNTRIKIVRNGEKTEPRTFNFVPTQESPIVREEIRKLNEEIKQNPKKAFGRDY